MAMRRQGLEWLESAHPVPDQRSERAARAALTLAGACGARRPAGRAGFRRRLVVDGAGGRRRGLSRQAGRDRAAAGRRRRHHARSTACGSICRRSRADGWPRPAARALEAWLLSDVVGDDPSVIGSGPTVPDPTTFGEALDVLDRLGGRAAYPGAVVAHLEAGAAGRIARDAEAPGGPVPGHHARDWFGRARARRRRRSRACAGLRGRPPADAHHRRSSRGRRRPPGVDPAARSARPAGRVCVLASGETTVRVTGQGRGGRNQEFALASALALDGATSGASPAWAPTAWMVPPMRPAPGSTA